VAWFESKGFKDVASLITNSPTLLSMPIEGRLLPTLDLLLGELGRTIEEIEVWPRIFNYSIEHLRLRHQFIVLSNKAGRHGLSRTYRSSPFSFSKKMCGKSIEEFELFLQANAPERAGKPRSGDIFMARMAKETATNDSRKAKVAAERKRVAGLVHAAALSADANMAPKDAVREVQRMLLAARTKTELAYPAKTPWDGQPAAAAVAAEMVEVAAEPAAAEAASALAAEPVEVSAEPVAAEAASALTAEPVEVSAEPVAAETASAPAGGEGGAGGAEGSAAEEPPKP